MSNPKDMRTIEGSVASMGTESVGGSGPMPGVEINSFAGEPIVSSDAPPTLDQEAANAGVTHGPDVLKLSPSVRQIVQTHNPSISDLREYRNLRGSANSGSGWMGEIAEKQSERLEKAA